MRKLVLAVVVVVGSWLCVSVTWGVAAKLTGLPGPSTVAHVATDAVADAAQTVELPPPLEVLRREATARIRHGGHTLARLYSGPERLAAGLVSRAGVRVEAPSCAAPLSAAEARAIAAS